MRPWLFLVASYFVLVTRPALAEPASGAGARAENDPAAYRSPPVVPLPPPEAPLRDPEEFARRQVELNLVASVGAVGCGAPPPASMATPDPCSSLGPSFGLDLHLLWRLVPHIAVGAWGGYDRFSWDATRGLGVPATGRGAGWAKVGLEARGYLFEEGAFDPYVGVAIGGGFLSMRADVEGVPQTLSRGGYGGAAMLGAAWWATARIRLGPELSLAWQPGGDVDGCVGGVCLDASGNVARIPSRVVRLGFGVTVGFGDEL